MVRLDRITMQGFKSFANRVTIPFPVGFNCVCGPNGSGKSNIVDALMFVLGTSSARSIRAMKLQNLLFNGAKSRKPADYCEVSLYLDNSDKKIPSDSELKVTRRITRSGISVYKLNGKTETRSRILDILSYANLSSEGYNIIMQGDVTKVIEMSPMERRGIIDEISGIREFDEKREKATTELEHVETRVRENMIVVAEKQKLVNRLRSEKENAEKYIKFNEELRKSKASLIKRQMDETQEKMKIFDKEIKEGTEKFDKLEKDFRILEDEIEKNERKIKELNDEIISKSRNYEIMRNIDSTQTSILRKKDKISLNEGEIKRLSEIGIIDKPTVREVMNLGYSGVLGTVLSLVEIPKKFAIAMDVAIGNHKDDIVTDNDEIATKCIKYLKEKKIGRARFLPLNRIRGEKRRQFEGEIIGYAIDLIKFDKKLYPALEYVLGNTLIVKDIDTARKIKDFRIVTLDGDLIEPSGAMIGGFYKKREGAISYSSEIAKLEEENEKLIKEIKDLEKELEKLKKMEKKESEEVVKLQETKAEMEKSIEEMRPKRKEIYEERIVLQNNVTRLKIEKAKMEATISNLTLEFEDFKDVKEFLKMSEDELRERVREYVIEINKLGPVNMKALEEFKIINVEFEELKKKLDKLLEEKDAIFKIVHEVEKKRYDKFMETMRIIAENFTRIYNDLTGGTGGIRLEIEDNIDSGLIIEASPIGKKVINLDAMSGGEKTITSLAFLFAIMQYRYSPFYVLDEIDAALDKTNTKKITNVIKKYSKDVQFIIITHNDITIMEADKVFGVSISEGVSKVIGIEMPKG